MFCRLWKKSNKMDSMLRGSSLLWSGIPCLSWSLCVMQISRSLKEICFVNLFCIAGMTYTFLFSLGWWQETQPGSWKWGERNLDVRHLETNFTLVRHGLLAIFFPLGMLLIFMLWWKSEMPPKTHMLKDSLPASGFVGRNGLMRALEFYGVIRRKWKL